MNPAQLRRMERVRGDFLGRLTGILSVVAAVSTPVLADPPSDSAGQTPATGFDLAGSAPVFVTAMPVGEAPRGLSVRISPLMPDAAPLPAYPGGAAARITADLATGLRQSVTLSDHADLSMTLGTAVSGYLRGRACQATHGSSGAQLINCRIGAGTAPHADGLDALFDRPPPDQLHLAVRYRLQF